MDFIYLALISPSRQVFLKEPMNRSSWLIGWSPSIQRFAPTNPNVFVPQRTIERFLVYDTHDFPLTLQYKPKPLQAKVDNQIIFLNYN